MEHNSPDFNWKGYYFILKRNFWRVPKDQYFVSFHFVPPLGATANVKGIM